jgi:hypothetical protein
MANMKKELLENLIRTCVREVLDQVSEKTTVGAPAPPAEGLGTAEQPAIPKDDKRIDELKKVIKKVIKEVFSK